MGDLGKPLTVMLKCILGKKELHWIHLSQNKVPLFHTEFLWTDTVMNVERKLNSLADCSL